MKNLLFLLLTVLFTNTLSAQELSNFKEAKNRNQKSIKQNAVYIDGIDSLMAKS